MSRFQIGSGSTVLIGAALMLAQAIAPEARAEPPNDLCADALTITTLPFSRTEPAAALAGASADDPMPSCTSGRAEHTVWLRYIPAATHRLTLTTRTSWHDNFLWVGSGTCGNLQEVACNDDGAGFFNADLEVIVEAGETYYIMAGAYSPQFWGQLTVIGELGDPLGSPPPNDTCAAATPIGSLPTTVTGTGSGAREEPGDLDPPCWGGADKYTVWWTYTSPIEQQVRIDTTDSTAETWVTVATGSCGDLQPIDCNHDDGPNGRGVIDFLARAGETYYVQLSRVFAPRAGDTLVLDVTEGSSAPVRVRVTDAQDGRPIPGAHVSLRDTQGGYYPVRDGYTDSVGEIELYPTYDDTFSAQVIAQGYRIDALWFNFIGNPVELDMPLTAMDVPRAASADPTRVVMPGEWMEAEALITFLPDGSDVRAIPLPELRFVSHPTWSPDGTRIAFTGVGWGGDDRAEIWIVNFDGTGLTTLTSFGGRPIGLDDLTWSPDGQWFAFAAQAGSWDPTTLWVVDAATGSDLTNTGVSGEDPTWSPDSSMLAFNKAWGVRVAHRDGTRESTVTTLTGELDWSNDGERLVVAVNSGAVYVVNLDGTGAEKVAAVQDNRAFRPVWSPDDCEILYIDDSISGNFPTRVATDGSSFRGAYYGSVSPSADIDWSFAPAPVDVPGDLKPRVELREPTGGELLSVGANFDIVWDASDDAEIVSQDLYLLTDDAATETPIALGLAGSVRRYSWSVPDTPSDLGAKIQVRVYDGVGQEHRATSRHPVSIAKPGDEHHAVWFTHPTGGETFAAGDTVTVTWDNDIEFWATPDGFHLELSLDGGYSYRIYVNDFLGSDQYSYDWTIPDYTTDRAVLRIRQGGAYTETPPFSISPGKWSSRVREGDAVGRLTLLGVRAGADAVFTWAATSMTNIHRTDHKTRLPGVWSEPQLAATLSGTHTDPDPPPALGQPWFYQLFGVDCRGTSVR